MATKTNCYTEGHARQNTSPSTQKIDCGLRAMKTYDNAESCAGRKKKILRKQLTTTLKKVPQHAANRPRSEGCEDRRCLTPKCVETKGVDCSTVRAVDPTRRIKFKQEIISK